MTSTRLLVTTSSPTAATADVLYNIRRLLAEQKPGAALAELTSLGDGTIADAVADPEKFLKQLVPTVLQLNDDVVLISGLTGSPVPSFDALDWDLQVAANCGAPVVAVIDVTGFSPQLVAGEVASLKRRVADAHATLAGIVVAGAANVELPAANGGHLARTPLTAADVQAFCAVKAEAVTPLAFRSNLLAQAAADRKRIVLPESEDERILQASAQLLEAQVADLILLGEPDQVNQRAAALGLDLSAAKVVSPNDPELAEKYAVELARVRAHKGMTLEKAREQIKDVTYFATLMVFIGDADGFVSGAIHTTADTLRPALQVIKTKPQASLVSSCFLMLLPDQMLVIGDSAVNIDPTPAELAEIAVETAQTAAQFGVDPRVALLSYSTMGSGKGASAEKVTEAAALVAERAPEVQAAGPLQFDAALIPSVGRQKAPGSTVAGHANVLVMPNLDAGNICYKAIQRTGGAVAVGPILQGLARPVNDLSRGATVEDIVNTVAITAVQAQG